MLAVDCLSCSPLCSLPTQVDPISLGFQGNIPPLCLIHYGYGLLQRCITGHCSKSGYALRATVMILLYAMGHCAKWSHTVKICNDFLAMGHSTRFSYAQWAIKQYLDMCYKAVFGYALWTVVQDLDMRYGPLR
jgi:hypothetical protein